MNKLKYIAFIVLAFGTSFKVHSETLDEAILRSGSVIAHHDIPPVLIAGQRYRFTWMTQSYVPIKSWLQVTNPDGIKQYEEATLERDVKGSYSIEEGQDSRASRNYYFSYNYTAPNDIGKATIGFYHGKDDGNPKLMYGLLPTGTVGRPSGTAGKQFFTNVCGQGNSGGQCVNYAREYFGDSYTSMPGLCVHSDCGAHHIYDDWDLGFGKGKIPKVNSLMVLDAGNALPVGHVAVVVAVNDNKDGTYELIVQESNWDLDENIDCAVSYEFDADSISVSRNGTGNYAVKGFVYSDAK